MVASILADPPAWRGSTGSRKISDLHITRQEADYRFHASASNGKNHIPSGEIGRRATADLVRISSKAIPRLVDRQLLVESTTTVTAKGTRALVVSSVVDFVDRFITAGELNVANGRAANSSRTVALLPAYDPKELGARLYYRSQAAAAGLIPTGCADPDVPTFLKEYEA